MPSITKKSKIVFLRNFVFGVEDSLVSTVGLLAGIAAADVPRATIFLTGAILVIVEAFSMGVGSLLSEESIEEYEGRKKPSESRSFAGGAIMFFSYIIAGLIPLVPYAFLERTEALPMSIAGSLGGLFLLGYISARRFNGKPFRTGMRMFLLGGLAILAGVVVGLVFKIG
ncbi:VIT1/CCC1 transporter family protein [Candidatus Uhrbacteria bacterium]|nr:VIT1/CCC1 transporter family protein [Candidatus Uhrbacteria bacterium]